MQGQILKPEANLTAVSSPSQWHNILVAVEGMSTESSQTSIFVWGSDYHKDDSL